MSYKKILVWEVNWIGDVIFSTPFIRAVRNRFPDAHITCIVTGKCRELLETNPNVNDVIVYDVKNIQKGLLGKWVFLRRLRSGKYDVAFLLHRSLTRALMCFLAGVRQRVGYFYKKRNFILTQKARHNPDPMHRIEYYLGLARKVGADTDDKKLDFFTAGPDEAYADNFFKYHKIKPDDIVVAVNPGGNWVPKRWPVERYAALCESLMARYKAKIIVTGAEKDVDLYLRMQELVTGKMLSVSGRTTLRQMGALFRRSTVVVSGDSGPLHVALAVGARAVALFGPTSPAITGPYGPGRYSVIQKVTECVIPCYNQKCCTAKCMLEITPDDVLAEIEKLLKIS